MYETKFPNAAALIANFKERADDIEKVQIVPEGMAFTGPDGDQIVLPNAGMVIHKVNGHREVVKKPDALRILADGILQRMRIKVEVLG
jgi:hypothetical protein